MSPIPLYMFGSLRCVVFVIFAFYFLLFFLSLYFPTISDFFSVVRFDVYVCTCFFFFLYFFSLCFYKLQLFHIVFDSVCSFSFLSEYACLPACDFIRSRCSRLLRINSHYTAHKGSNNTADLLLHVFFRTLIVLLFSLLSLVLFLVYMDSFTSIRIYIIKSRLKFMCFLCSAVPHVYKVAMLVHQPRFRIFGKINKTQNVCIIFVKR